MSVYRVYWSTRVSVKEDLTGFAPKAQDFGADEMTEALELCAYLRRDKSNCFITLVAEDPNCTSLSGVSAPTTDYKWEKRRGGRK